MDNLELSQNKSLAELSREALWFCIHTLIAVAMLALVVAAMSLTRPDPDALTPKIVGTVLAFLVPLACGFLVAQSRQNRIARHVWISGLLTFSVVSVWVLDLPTGNGLCDKCGAVEKLWRTFFAINHGSGLMAGDGLFLGTWIPLAMIGYALGARYALTKQE
ncbi:MAG TPA: hypothetical protein VH250_05780 [Granulicella sp.]|nr:hypothetical protein [Granulicella sp.]